MAFSKIIGTGSYLPEKILTNADIAKFVDTSDEWIVERTGIKQRHIAADDELTSDLATKASIEALKDAGIEADTLDLIIVATTTPDHSFPSVATKVQFQLGANRCPAFDLQAVCAGFAYAMTVADQFIRAGSAKRVLVIGAETFSRLLDWNDRTTCVLFGDGAGAVVLEASETPGIEAAHIHASGKFTEALWVPKGVSNSHDEIATAQAFVKMDGQRVFKWAVKEMADLAQKTLDENGLTGDDIDWMVPHQANVRIIEAVANRVGMPMERVIKTVQDHGNTSAASVPLALDYGIRCGKIKKGDRLLLEAFGGGFAWGSILLTL